jgi:putative NIF3 family GTP cyclohydrolase 1 type 2
MELQALYVLLNELAPGYADANTMPVWHSTQPLHRMGVCVDPTVVNLRIAREAGVELLISYHPRRREAEGVAGPEGLPVIPLHTAWDNAARGINATLAAALGGSNLELSETGCMMESGVTLRELIENCQRVLGSNVLPYWGEPQDTASRVGIWAGPGFLPHFEPIWEDFVRRGCDTIISGEMTLPALRFAAEHGLRLIDTGHGLIAGFGMRHLHDLLRERLLTHGCELLYFEDCYAPNYHTAWFFKDQLDVEETLPLFSINSNDNKLE